MTELVLRFEHLVGRAALKLWSDLPRDLQERLFEDAVGGDEVLRHNLAIYLHDHHPRNYPPAKPDCCGLDLPNETQPGKE